MTWDLISLKSHPHRSAGDDVMVLLRKTTRRSERAGVSAIQFHIEVSPFPLVVRQGNTRQLVPLESAHFRVTADLAEGKLLFDIGSADAALPSLLRGGGLGSLAISELVIWCKKQFPAFRVANGHISAGLLGAPNAEQMAVSCLKNLGFAVARAPTGGLQFEAASVAQLKPHINAAKLEHANPIQWGSALAQDNFRLAAQLLEHSREIADLKEQLFQLTQAKLSPVPFLGGILAGCVAGSAIAAVLFSL